MKVNPAKTTAAMGEKARLMAPFWLLEAAVGEAPAPLEVVLVPALVVEAVMVAVLTVEVETRETVAVPSSTSMKLAATRLPSLAFSA